MSMEPKEKNIYEEIFMERLKQDQKWGEQNHPILDPQLIDRNAQRMAEEYEIPTEARGKQLCEGNFKRGTGTYMHILIEEISESVACMKDTKAMRQELIQSAAVIVAMIESLDRNGR